MNERGIRLKWTPRTSSKRSRLGSSACGGCQRLVMDRAGWHTATCLEIPRNIHIEYLPPYSPELNPVKRLWRWPHRHIYRNQLFDSENHLADSLCAAVDNLSAPFLASLCRCNYMSCRTSIRNSYNLECNLVSALCQSRPLAQAQLMILFPLITDRRGARGR
jgi:transposase